MQIAIISDNHDNYRTLNHVPKGLDKYYHLGDICEQDPESARKCIEKLNDLGAECVLGRHDRAIFSHEDRRYFYLQAMLGYRRADNHRNVMNAERLSRKLGSDYVEWLQKWKDPVKEVVLEGGYKIVLVHDSLAKLSKDESNAIGLGGLYKSRVVSAELAWKNFRERDFNLLAVGHTHIPLLWKEEENLGTPELSMFGERNPDKLLDRNKRYILCPGSMCGDSGITLIPHHRPPLKEDEDRNSFSILSYGSDRDTVLVTTKFFKTGE